jgi:hypothetical protein
VERQLIPVETGVGEVRSNLWRHEVERRVDPVHQAGVKRYHSFGQFGLGKMVVLGWHADEKVDQTKGGRVEHLGYLSAGCWRDIFNHDDGWIRKCQDTFGLQSRERWLKRDCRIVQPV